MRSFSQGSRLKEIEILRKELREHKPISLGVALAASRERVATEKRDHVYGCLSLAGASPTRINVDYEKRVLEVFEDATRALVDEGQTRAGGLNFLACCTLCEGENDSISPSWTVRFDQMDEREAMCTPFGSDLGFAATGNHTAVAVYCSREALCPKPSVLEVQGVCLDIVHIVGNAQVSLSASRFVEETMHNFYKECRSLLMEARGSMTPHSSLSDLTDLHRTLIYDWMMTEADMPLDHEPWCPAYLRSAMATCFGRRFVLTKTGYMGLAPRTAQPGDAIFLIAGCDVPLILRKAKSIRFESRVVINDEQCLQYGMAHAEHTSFGRHEESYQIIGNACEFTLNTEDHWLRK